MHGVCRALSGLLHRFTRKPGASPQAVTFGAFSPEEVNDAPSACVRGYLPNRGPRRVFPAHGFRAEGPQCDSPSWSEPHERRPGSTMRIIVFALQGRHRTGRWFAARRRVALSGLIRMAARTRGLMAVGLHAGLSARILIVFKPELPLPRKPSRSLLTGNPRPLPYCAKRPPQYH